jgi:hypothetical protein
MVLSLAMLLLLVVVVVGQGVTGLVVLLVGGAEVAGLQGGPLLLPMVLTVLALVTQGARPAAHDSSSSSNSNSSCGAPSSRASTAEQLKHHKGTAARLTPNSSSRVLPRRHQHCPLVLVLLGLVSLQLPPLLQLLLLLVCSRAQEMEEVVGGAGDGVMGTPGVGAPEAGGGVGVRGLEVNRGVTLTTAGVTAAGVVVAVEGSGEGLGVVVVGGRGDVGTAGVAAAAMAAGQLLAGPERVLGVGLSEALSST